MGKPILNELFETKNKHIEEVPAIDKDEFIKAVKSRRSVRNFTDDPVLEKDMRECLELTLLAPNSSNLQPWEFYWIKDKNNKNDLRKACFSQNAAKTAQELIVAVSRIDTWKRNRNLILENYKTNGNLLPVVEKYYNKLIPLSYAHDRIGILGIMKKIMSFFIGIVGFFKPVPRGPIFRHDVFEIVTKTTALACQNFMMALVLSCVVIPYDCFEP